MAKQPPSNQQAERKFVADPRQPSRLLLVVSSLLLVGWILYLCSLALR